MSSQQSRRDFIKASARMAALAAVAPAAMVFSIRDLGFGVSRDVDAAERP
jgi:hypothetical protein